ncbi:MAG: site-2 protease family protein [Clostridia bacterium]|nr:site-2 protease family protein [Clostridia bacterium]
MLTNFDLTNLLISAVAALIALTLHEFSHGFMAYKLGDKTAYHMGRLTLNPLRHLDPFGTVCMIFFRFGWARPVPINARNFKKPRRDIALTALAGPLINILSGFIFSLITLLLLLLHFKVGRVSNVAFVYNVTYYAFMFFGVFTVTSVGLGVFNMLPIPPFDGSRILFALLPPKLYFKITKHERGIYFFFVGWLLIGGFLYRGLMSIPAIASNGALSSVLRILSLSGLISDATSFICQAMLDLWHLLPIFDSIPMLLV